MPSEIDQVIDNFGQDYYHKKVSYNDFHIEMLLGRGAFGKVKNKFIFFKGKKIKKINYSSRKIDFNFLNFHNFLFSLGQSWNLSRKEICYKIN